MYKRLDAKRGINNIVNLTDSNWLKNCKSGADVSARDIMFAHLYCIRIRTRQGYTVKYKPLPEGVPEGKARGNSWRQRVYLTVYPSSRPNTDIIFNILHDALQILIIYWNKPIGIISLYVWSCFSQIYLSPLQPRIFDNPINYKFSWTLP